MTAVVWDQVGDRRYETGVDHAVLYLEELAVAWNGLTSFEEDHSSRTATPHYIDGVRYLNAISPGDFDATLKAYTYPDEFLAVEGLASTDHGLFLDNQPGKTFGLSYRTKVGNDTEGLRHGYKIHLVYNASVLPDNKTFDTQTQIGLPTEFSWRVVTVPEMVTGYRPTAHAVLDSRAMPSSLLSDIETILYGSDGSDPRLPSLSELVGILGDWVGVTIIDHGDGTWSAIGPPELVGMLDGETFSVDEDSAVYLDGDTFEVSTD